MPDIFELRLPTSDGQNFVHTLNVGDILFVLGANGAGKSSLITRIANQNSQHCKRICAHRKTWFESNAIDITPHNREQLFNHIKNNDANEQSRWKQWNPDQRAGLCIYDLIDSETCIERKVTELLRSDDLKEAVKLAKTPSPIKIMNEIMRLSNIPVEISVEDKQKVVARKNGGNPYSVAELSDGERNAFLIAADILTAEPGTLILVDEPERHLHRSIISPLLTLLFRQRQDCCFIISTHEMMLPVDNNTSQTLLVRSCTFSGSSAASWEINLIGADADIDDETKRDIIGARKEILFVEGKTHSLDLPMYCLLYPHVSVIPKNGCREVEHAVKGLRAVSNMHWVNACGMVDNDRREQADIERLSSLGIHVLPFYSIESLYYLPEILNKVAARWAEVIGDNPEHSVDAAITIALCEARKCKTHFVYHVVDKFVRNKLLFSFPTRDQMLNGDSFSASVDIKSIRTAEEARFDELTAANNFEGLLRYYPIRESPALDRLVSGLNFPNRATYEKAVLKLLQDDETCLDYLRALIDLTMPWNTII